MGFVYLFALFMTSDEIFYSAVWQPPWVCQCNCWHGCVTSSCVSTAQGCYWRSGLRQVAEHQSQLCCHCRKFSTWSFELGCNLRCNEAAVAQLYDVPFLWEFAARVEGPEAGYHCIALYFQQQGNKTMTSRVKLSSYVGFHFLVFRRMHRILWIKGW